MTKPAFWILIQVQRPTSPKSERTFSNFEKILTPNYPAIVQNPLDQNSPGTPVSEEKRKEMQIANVYIMIEADK